eukprot:gene3035-3311_t
MIAFFIPFFFFFLAFYPTLHNASTIHTTTTTTTIDLIRYLQKEQTAVTSAQRDIIDFLHSKKISIGREPTHPILGQQDSISDDESSLKAHVAISTESHPIECRVTLGPAPPGSLCVAPCGCTGSQKWVQFQVLNKLRRKEPNQWTTCPTCRQAFRHDLFLSHANLQANLVGMLLDKISIVRWILFSSCLVIGYLISFPGLIEKFLVSKTFWQAYPHWSKIVSIPLALKIWLGKLVLQYLVEKYLWFEKTFLVDYLASLETSLIEESLPLDDLVKEED